VSSRCWKVALAIILGLSNARALRADEHYWQQYVHYVMNVSLDPEKHVLTGSETILYKNNSPATLDRIYLHLYPNAFKDENTTPAREARRYYQRVIHRDPHARGYIDITDFRIYPKNRAADSLEVPTTSFQVNETILEAKLHEPLAPGDSVRIDLNFFEKIRKFSDRAGYRGSQFDLAQWYPKVVVYDQEGWHPEPHHLFTEFYGEFGTFDVTITVPYDYIIAATGVPVQGDPGWNEVRVDTALSGEAWKKAYQAMKDTLKARAQRLKMRTVTFHAEQVHDFAWLTSPDFLYERGEWEGIPIHVLYRSSAKNRWSKVVVQRGRRALEWLSTKFGRYPYPQLSITHGLLGGGMEYPMLVMNSSESEGLIFHEVGHIYFYGLFGNNEVKEAWLDEGFTSFQTEWYLETRYGPWGYDREEAMKKASWLQRRRPANTSRDGSLNWALSYMNSGFNEPISKPGYTFKDGGAYGVNSYTKGALFYDMLRYIVGDTTWEKICHEYFRHWALKHVNEARFKQVCEDVSGMDLDWFFNEWLHDTVTIDYALGSVKKKRVHTSWQTEVEVRRKDRGIMPVEVEVLTEAGERQVKRWDGEGEKGTLTFVTDGKPRSVVVDPDDRILDTNRLNNGGARVELHPKYPGMYYSPRSAYLVTWKPSAWYNDLDGLRVGAIFNGNYGNRMHWLDLGLWFGVKSKEVDGLFRLKNRLGFFGPRTQYQLVARKIEGRIVADASLQFTFSRYRYTPPIHELQIGANFLRVDDEAYGFRKYRGQGETVRVNEWEQGNIYKAYLTYGVNPRGMGWQSTLEVGVEAARTQGFAVGGLNFGRAYGTATVEVNPLGTTVRLRGFGGTSFGDDGHLPLQEQFYANGAGAQARFEKFYLRSPGSWPAVVNYHLRGSANLRGYYDQPELRGKRLVGTNVEAQRQVSFPLLGSLLRKTRVTTTLSAFADGGGVWLIDGSQQDLFDAGVGLRLQRSLWGRAHLLRVDFPLWVSDPLPGEDQLKFRWVIGFGEAL